MAKPYSAQYVAMESNIDLLRRTLLPPISISGNYTSEDQIRIKSFRVMAHAELEYYFEKRCEEIATATKAATNPKYVTKVTDSLKLFYAEQRNSEYAWRKSDGELFGIYSRQIRKNHGIKEPNIFRMLKPLGFHAGLIDQTLVATLDSYGDIRGRLAHNAITHVPQNQQGATLVIDPSVEISDIGLIMNSLKALDRKLDKLLT